MKKILAVLLAVFIVFSLMTVAAYAEEEPAAEVAEEETTVYTQNDDETVIPASNLSLRFSFLFKVVEKFLKFVFGIFGRDLDVTMSGSAAGFAAFIEEIISNLDAGVAA